MAVLTIIPLDYVGTFAFLVVNYGALLNNI